MFHSGFSVKNGRGLFPFACLALFACTPSTPLHPTATSLYLYRFEPPAFVEFSADFQPLGEIPFFPPPHCGLFNVFAPRQGPVLAVELSCPYGQTVLFLDTSLRGDSAVTRAVPDSDSHFLAWAHDGTGAYLKIDSLGSPRVVLASPDGRRRPLPISEFTYDLAPSPEPGEFTLSLSRGMGQGSELQLARTDGKSTETLYADPFHYLSFARFSPDGRQIAFIKIPDTRTPFTVGELWVIDSDGSEAHKLADADAGHGFAPSWSPDGRRIAFVVRENPDDELADRSSEALIGNIFLVDVQSGALTRVTDFVEGRAEAPFWSPGGNMLAFTTVINDRMQVHLADPETGETRPLIAEATCCPVWMQK